MIWLRTPLFGLIPTRLARILQRGDLSTGLVVRGWFHRGFYVVATAGWWSVTVVVDGRVAGTVAQGGVRASTVRHSLAPGQYTVQFLGYGMTESHLPLRTETITVRPREISYIAFLPPSPNQFRTKPNLRSKWEVRTLTASDINGLRPWILPWYCRLPPK